jgi:Bacterial regulatory protein, Fis family
MEFWKLGMKLEDVERKAILEAFRFFQGNKTRTAAALNIAIRTLDAKLSQYLPQEVKKEEVHGDNSLEERRRANQRVFQTTLSAARGLHMEPDVEASQKREVSMSEREEVQEMLPSQDAKGHSKRRNVQKGA